METAGDRSEVYEIHPSCDDTKACLGTHVHSMELLFNSFVRRFVGPGPSRRGEVTRALGCVPPRLRGITTDPRKADCIAGLDKPLCATTLASIGASP